MPFDLNEMDRIDRIEDEQEQHELLGRLEEIRQELELYDSPLWPQFRSRLLDEERKALNEMLTGEADSILLAREKVKLVRHLASFEERLRQEQAQKEKALADLTAFEDEGE